MTTYKKIKDLAPLFLAVILYGCPPQEVELPGDISGHVRDVVTEESVKDAEILLFHTNDSIGADTTGEDGKFLFTNLESDHYSIEVNKDLYARHTENVTVFPAETYDLEITIGGTPDPEFSEPWLNFGMESTQLSFSISNAGGGILSYEIIPTQDWISVSKDSGEVTQDPDLIEVTIQKEGLKELSHKAGIEIHSDILGDIQVDNLEVYVNYVMDQDSLLYRTVRIGDQVWMAENLNTGIRVVAPGDLPTSNNGLIEKLCYDNDSLNCDIYGGLYTWDEMMNYAPADNGGIQTTQGICPEGWHIPTLQEWTYLGDYLGEDNPGGRLKDSSPLWTIPNAGATNETGFSALPAGKYTSIGFNVKDEFELLELRTFFWTTYMDNTATFVYQLIYHSSTFTRTAIDYFPHVPDAMSVRCIKDP